MPRKKKTFNGVQFALVDGVQFALVLFGQNIASSVKKTPHSALFPPRRLEWMGPHDTDIR